MKKVILIFFILTTLLLSSVAVVGYFINRPYTNDPVRVQMYELKQVRPTLEHLERDRMIYSAQLTAWLLSILGYDVALQKGVYEINNHMSTWEIVSMWKSGKQKIIVFTIKEGDDLYDIGENLLRLKMVSSQREWLGLVQSPELLAITKNTLGLAPETKVHTLEGFLFPETYYLFAGNSALDLINIAVLEFKKKTKTILDSTLSDEYKLAVFKVASLVEKETHLLEEKPIVASVIYNRLKVDMKLRIDPTIIYALKAMGEYHNNFKDGFINIKREHYSIKSSYNTYYIKGLPITPISSFSVSSLQAAVNPAETSYLFFVAKKKGKPELGHYFTTNYEDHLKYVNQLVKKP